MAMRTDIGLIHFIGIGGIGMSAIAEVLHERGFQVQGSDQAEGANVVRLREKGIRVFCPHDAGNVDGASVVVTSTAVKEDNVERRRAVDLRLPIVARAEMLAELMRGKRGIAAGGTHGKTTTTSMIGTLLEEADLDPTIVNGGILNHLGTNVRMGGGEWVVVEADESDGSFLKLPAEIAVVTNIDPEHLDHYGTFDKARDAFRQFVAQIPFYGYGVLCIDHPEVQAIRARVPERHIITYGRNPQAHARYRRVTQEGTVSRFDVELRHVSKDRAENIEALELPMPGLHNVANATAAIAIAWHLGASAQAIRSGLAKFSGVKRRFTHTGVWNGVNVYDDYGHHPVEIEAVLRAARDTTDGRIIAVHQPHRYSRLGDLMEEFASCFNNADTALIAPVYAAGEAPVEGVDHASLVRRLAAAGHRDARTIEGPDEIAPLVRGIAREGDLVIFLGAGNITNWAYALPEELGDADG